MNIRVKTFASVADVCGFKERVISIPDGSTAQAILELLVQEFPQLSRLKDKILVAINEEHASFDIALSDGDEVALFPPVSGG